MASLHVVIDPVSITPKPRKKVAPPKLGIREPEGTISRKETVVKVLERAAEDPAFITQLTYQGSEALQSYNLTMEEKAALTSGDIAWMEAHHGKLDERLSTWLQCRLQQEIW
jgi:hypothetical protein